MVAASSPAGPQGRAGTPFAQPLRAVLAAVEGALGIAVVAEDGIIVHQERSPGGPDLAPIVAHMTDIYRRSAAAASECGLGRTMETIQKTSSHSLLLLSVAEGYAILLVLDRDAFVGRGRWELRKAAESVRDELTA